MYRSLVFLGSWRVEERGGGGWLIYFVSEGYVFFELNV